MIQTYELPKISLLCVKLTRNTFLSPTTSEIGGSYMARLNFITVSSIYVIDESFVPRAGFTAWRKR